MRAARAWALGAALLLAAGCGGGSGDPLTRIVVVTWDTTRADRIGAYGYERPTTPHVDRFADDGVLFEQAVSTVPTTLPSHATMFTGLYPQDHGVPYNVIYRLGDEAETVAESLAAAGYRTAGFPASYVLHGDFGIAQGFEHWIDPPVDTNQRDPAMQGARIASEGVDDALAWLEQREVGEKLFLWVHFYDPHHPFTPPFPYSAQYRDRPYDGEIAYTDEQFGRLMDALEAHPDWDDTAVLMVGDHGEGLQDHGESWHTYLLYESTQRVPLIVREPGVRPRRVAEPVSIADVAPTVLEWAGLAPAEDIRGLSLRGPMRGETPQPRFIYFETRAGALNFGWQEIRGVRFDRWKLIDSSEPEIYDLETDPDELENLVESDPERLARFRNELAGLGVPVRETSGELIEQELSPEAQAKLAALGYVVGGTGGEVAEDARTPQSQIHLETEIQTARIAIKQGNWPYVEDLCRYVYERDPYNKWALTNLTTALLEQGRPAEADPYSEQLLNLYPQNPNSYMTRGRALSEMGRPQEAYDLIVAGREQLPEDEHLGYLQLVAGFDAGLDVCGGLIGQVTSEFSGSGRIRVLHARCALRGEGGVRAALEELAAAVSLGYDRLDSLRRFEEFAPVVADERFEQLVEVVKQRKRLNVQTFAGSPEEP